MRTQEMRELIGALVQFAIAQRASASPNCGFISVALRIFRQKLLQDVRHALVLPGFVRLQSMQSGNNFLLDLRSPGINFAGDRVAQFALDLIFGHVSVATMNLNGIETALDT